MPSLNDIATMAEALEKSPVVVVRDRCVAVRNRNASCRRCVCACPVDAITVRANEVTLDAGACMGCGACVISCPTEALVPIQPSEQAVLDAAARSASRNGGRAVVACARAASKRQADPARYAEVPCLPRVDESLVLALAAQGAESVLLVDGNCETCKHRLCLTAMNEAATRTARLLSAHGISLSCERVTGFPADMRAEGAAGLRGSTRRGFFSEAAAATKEAAKAAAKTTIESELGYKSAEPTIGERLHVTEDGTLPQLRMHRHEAILNALDAVGKQPAGAIDSRLFGSVDIDMARCNACGMCAVFCPTGALKRDPADKPSAPIRYFEFSACDCVQCRLCEDVCWKGALSLTEAVEASELYDFEPRTFKLPKVLKRRAL